MSVVGRDEEFLDVGAVAAGVGEPVDEGHNCDCCCGAFILFVVTKVGGWVGGRSGGDIKDVALSPRDFVDEVLPLGEGGGAFFDGEGWEEGGEGVVLEDAGDLEGGEIGEKVGD